MIAGWADRSLRLFFEQDRPSRKIPADLRNRLFRRLQMLDDASCDADLRIPTSNHFEKLAGSLDGWCSLRVNLQWRLIFRWDGKDASEVYLDSHTYR